MSWHKNPSPPLMETPDPPNDTPGASKQLVLRPHDIARILRVTYISRWWFQIFFIFIPIWGRFPIWRTYFSKGWFNHQLDLNCMSLFLGISSGKNFTIYCWIPDSESWSGPSGPKSPRKIPLASMFLGAPENLTNSYPEKRDEHFNRKYNWTKIIIVFQGQKC